MHRNLYLVLIIGTDLKYKQPNWYTDTNYKFCMDTTGRYMQKIISPDIILSYIFFFEIH